MHVRGLATVASHVGAVNVTRMHEISVEAVPLVRPCVVRCVVAVLAEHGALWVVECWVPAGGPRDRAWSAAACAQGLDYTWLRYPEGWKDDWVRLNKGGKHKTWTV